MNGKVIFFDSKKGWGYIAPADGSADLFVHFSDIQAQGFKTLKDGQEVTYDMGAGPKGPKAINVIGKEV